MVSSFGSAVAVVDSEDVLSFFLKERRIFDRFIRYFIFNSERTIVIMFVDLREGEKVDLMPL